MRSTKRSSDREKERNIQRVVKSPREEKRMLERQREMKNILKRLRDKEKLKES
jgi:hypothetical protein